MVWNKYIQLADLNPPSLSLSFQTTLFWFKRFLYRVFSKVPRCIHPHRLTAVLLVACSQSFQLSLEAPSTIQLNPVAQLSRKRYETTLGWNRFVDDSKWNNAGAFGFLLGNISWWIGHFLTNSYFNHVRIHAHWDFPGRRTCYQDLPSSGRRTNTMSATCRNHKKNTCPMPNPPKVTARPVSSRLPPQCFPMAGNTGFDWIPVGDSKVLDSYLIQQLIVVILVTVTRSPRFPTRFISSHQSHEHVFWIAAAFAGL